MVFHLLCIEAEIGSIRGWGLGLGWKSLCAPILWAPSVLIIREYEAMMIMTPVKTIQVWGPTNAASVACVHLCYKLCYNQGIGTRRARAKIFVTRRHYWDTSVRAICHQSNDDGDGDGQERLIRLFFFIWFSTCLSNSLQFTKEIFILSTFLEQRTSNFTTNPL